MIRLALIGGGHVAFDNMIDLFDFIIERMALGGEI